MKPTDLNLDHAREIQREAVALSLPLGETLVEAIDAISQRHGDEASGMVLLTAALAQTLSHLAVTVCAAMHASKPDEAMDEFLRIAVGQIASGAETLRGERTKMFATVMAAEAAAK